MGQPSRLATRLPRSACLRTLQPLLQPLLIVLGAWRISPNCEAIARRGGYAGWGWRRKGTFTRFSNHHHESIRRQPRGGFGSYAPLANRVTNTALSPAIFAWGLRQRGVDNSVLHASLSNLESFNAISGPILLRLHVPFAPVANRSCQQRGGSGLFVKAYAAPAVDKPD